MKNHYLIFFVVTFTIFIGGLSVAQNIPASQRSIKAMQEKTAILENELSAKNLSLSANIYLRIFKQEAELEVWLKKDQHFELFKTYDICNYGVAGLGPKLKEGDGKAPEGFYFVKANQMNPYSSYHLSFNLGYPNAYDRAHDRTGSALMVHGDCVSVGCYAMTNDKMEEIYTLAHKALENGQDFFRVHIFPFKMTDQNMLKHKTSPWYANWKNLKEGYDYFYDHNFNPPNVTVKNQQYIFD